jgi:hypothetical protein
MPTGRRKRRNFVLYCTLGLLVWLFIGGCTVDFGNINVPYSEGFGGRLAFALAVVLGFNAAFVILALTVPPDARALRQGRLLMLLGALYVPAGALAFARIKEVMGFSGPFVLVLILVKGMLAVWYGAAVGQEDA